MNTANVASTNTAYEKHLILSAESFAPETKFIASRRNHAPNRNKNTLILAYMVEA